MPSNIFANTGTNVSILFIDKKADPGKVVLVDASKLGETVKEGKNQRTVLTPQEESRIINAMNKKQAIADFSVVVNQQQIAEKNYSFSAGQYFEVKIAYTDITAKEFAAKMQGFEERLSRLSTTDEQMDKDMNK